MTDEQLSALEQQARSEGISKAELVRRLVDQALGGDADDLARDLAAIEQSFGALADEDIVFERGPDGRTRHLRRVAGG